jgi:hypothetical protein
LLVPRLGNQQLDVGVRDVSSQVLVTTRVVEANQDRPDESRTAQREYIVRGVVQEYGDVGWSTGIEPSAIQGGESLGFQKKLFVGPDLLAEAKRGTTGPLRVEAVASEKGGHVPSRQRHLAQGRG